MTASAAIRTLLGSVLLGVAIVWAMLISAPRTAYACSGQPIPPNDESLRYVVGGWIRAISYEEQHPINELETIPMTYTFEVDRTWRGSPPSSFTFVDRASAVGDTDNIFWGAMCGAMREDPTDSYFLLAIPHDGGGFGAYHVYGVASGPDDSSLEWGLNFIAEGLGLRTGPAGNAGLAKPVSGAERSAIALGAFAVLLVLMSRLVTGRTPAVNARE